MATSTVAITAFVIVASATPARPGPTEQQSAAEAEKLVQAGVERLSRGEFEAAAASFRLAMQLNPALAAAHFGAGVALANLQQFEQAIQYFKRAIELRPEFATAYLNLGLAQVRLGNDAAAMAALQEAVRLAPQLVDAHRALGALFAKLGRWSEADRLVPRGDQDSAATTSLACLGSEWPAARSAISTSRSTP